MSDLVLVSTRANVEAAVRLPGARRLVALGWEAEEELDRLGRPYVALDAFLDDRGFRDATERAYEWATTWYLDPAVAPALQLDGINLGRTVEYPLYYLFLTALRTVAAFRTLAAVESPLRIFTVAQDSSTADALAVRDGDAFFQGTVLAAARQCGIPVEMLASASAVAPQDAVAPTGVRVRLGRLAVPVPPAIHGLVRALAQRASRRPLGHGAVCFLSPDGGLHALYEAVFAEVRERGIPVMILARERRTARTLPIETTSELVPAREREARREALTDAWTRVAPVLARGFVVDGVALGPVFEQRFARIFRDDLPAAGDTIGAVRVLAAQRRIGSLIAVNEVSEFFRAGFLAGNAYGIPAVTLLHGIPTRLHQVFIGNEPAIATTMAVWGEACRAVKIDNGADPDRLVVTGAPHFDVMARAAASRRRPVGDARRAALRRLGLDPDRRVVVFAPDHFNVGKLTHDVTLTPVQHAALVLAVTRAVAAIPEAQLAVKLKTADQARARVAGLARRAGATDVKFLDPARSWPEIFDVADALVVTHSTLGVEALLHDVPCVTVNFTGGPDRVEYAKGGVAVGVYEEAALEPAIRDVLFRPEVRAELRAATPAFLRAYAGPLDGASAARTADLILGVGMAARALEACAR